MLLPAELIPDVSIGSLAEDVILIALKGRAAIPVARVWASAARAEQAANARVVAEEAIARVRR